MKEINEKEPNAASQISTASFEMNFRSRVTGFVPKFLSRRLSRKLKFACQK